MISLGCGRGSEAKLPKDFTRKVLDKDPAGNAIITGGKHQTHTAATRISYGTGSQ